MPEKYSNTLSIDLNNYLSNTLCYSKYLEKIFANLNLDIRLISHAKRFPKTYALAETLEKMGHKNYLISHGSHTIQECSPINKLAANQLALGLLFLENYIMWPTFRRSI